MITKKWRRRHSRRTYRQTNRYTERHISSTGPGRGTLVPLWGDICIVMLDPQTGNVFVLISSVGVQYHNAFIWVQKIQWATRQTDIKSQTARRQPDGWTYGHIILPLRVFETIACIRMRCEKLQAVLMNSYWQLKAVCSNKNTNIINIKNIY